MMMTINANTKIASLLKHNMEALEAIVSLSPKFTKLRNPFLRKLMAGRTSIAMASKIGGCRVDDFFNKLQPLGFEIDRTAVVAENGVTNNSIPAFMKNIAADTIVELDVRPIIEAGNDPLDVIVKAVKAMKTGSVIKIINSFEPTPLIHLLRKQGFEAYAETISDVLVFTYFFKKGEEILLHRDEETDHSKGWNEMMDRYKGKLQTIDVRSLEMPLPMHAILEALETLPNDKALFVYHKRIPVFLLPELEAQHCSYRIREISSTEVHLLIYKK